MYRVFSLLPLLCPSSVLGAHLRRAHAAATAACPTQRPNLGQVCSPATLGAVSPQHCEYDFLQTPDSNADYACTGTLTCLPMTSCICDTNTQVWECRDISGDSLHGCSDFPQGSFESCTPTKKKNENNHDDTNKIALIEMESTLVHDMAVVEQKERMVAFPQEQEQQHVGACPIVAPLAGSVCSVASKSACPYEFTNLPVYLEDGYCHESDTQCVPLKTCECSSSTGVWECTAQSIRRCRGLTTPTDAFQVCSPNSS